MAKKEIEHTSTTLGNQDMKGSQRMVSVVEPYELPEGWEWVKVGEVAEIINGKNQKEVEDENGIYPIYGSGGIIGRATDFICPENCTIIGRKGTINNPIFVETKFWNVDTAFGMKTFDCVAPKFYFYFCKSFNFLTLDSSTAIPSLTKSNIQQIPFPLPPTLAEQQRIVNRIESMFAKLDEAKEKAQNVVDGFEIRKAAILHKAFTGELTAKWRKENGVSDDSWEEKTIGEICLVKGGKRVPKGMSLIKEKNEHPYLKAGNLKFGTVIDKDMEYVPNDVFILIKNYTVNAGDVYITNVGACIGDCGIIPDYYHGASLTENAVKLTEMICINSYLAKQLSSNLVQTQIKSKIKSATLGKLSIDNIKQLKINLPTLPEQQEIVRILDSVLEKERTAKQAAEAVLEQIDLLKKSILARAFRGEL